MLGHKLTEKHNFIINGKITLENITSGIGSQSMERLDKNVLLKYIIVT